MKKTLFKLGIRTRREGAKEETPFFDLREGFRVGNGKLPLQEAKASLVEDLTPPRVYIKKESMGERLPGGRL